MSKLETNVIVSQPLCDVNLEIARNYCNNPEIYTKRHILTVNGKRRQIVTYSDTTEGNDLRELHNVTAKYLSNKYKSAESSFAYKKQISIVDCIEKHLNNDVFLKSDVYHYFDTISFENTKAKLVNLVSVDEYNKFIILLEACFFNGTLPIGFVSSPVISDFFLSDVDKVLEKEEGIVYTRYADDFIISSSGDDAEDKLLLFKEKLDELVKSNGLLLNTKKTYVRRLKTPGEAIHVLGVNIVKTDSDKNRVTVSDSYIRDTSRKICWLINHAKKLDDDEIVDKIMAYSGRAEFIKMCSKDSYNKLKKMIKVKRGLSVQPTYKGLEAIVFAESD